MSPFAARRVVPRSRRISLLIGAAFFLACIWGFIEIAEDYPEGRYQHFDEALLRSFRTPGNLAAPRGPLWLKDVMRDISALGSAVVLASTVLGVAGYLAVQRQWKRALSLALACGGGALLNVGLKAVASRPRPDIVPHLTEVTSSSFPSGHSMISAIIYLSVGLIAAETAAGKAAATYAIVVAAILPVAIGCTRVYLGVHYPSDVLAGWIAGTAWTLLCIAVRSLARRRVALSEENENA
jgi:undecaprenyl-diphosphatase